MFTQQDGVYGVDLTSKTVWVYRVQDGKIVEETQVPKEQRQEAMLRMICDQDC